MRRLKYTTVLAILTAVLLPAVASLAQQSEKRLNVDFADTPLSDIMQVFKQVGGISNFVLPPGAGDKRVTVSLVDKTVPEALTVVLDAAGLTAVNDGGTYVIKEKASARETAPRAVPRISTTPTVTRTPPGLNRLQPEATEVGRGSAVATVPGAPGTKSKQDKVYRWIVPNYANLMMLADMFGGGYVSEDDYRNSSSGSTGGYGNNSGGYGNNNQSNTGNRSNSRGGNSNRSSRTNTGW